MLLVARVLRKIIKIMIVCIPYKALIWLIDVESKKPHLPPVLMYHHITEEAEVSEYNMNVSKKTFSDTIKLFNELGYSYMFEDEYSCVIGKRIMLTFDDGYADNFTNMFPCLVEKEKVTVNLIASTINEPNERYLSIEQIKEMQLSGRVSFESHTFSHALLSECTLEKIKDELKDSKDLLDTVVGGVSCIVYPCNRANTIVAKVAKKYYKYGFGTTSKEYPNMNIHRIATSEDLVGKKLLQSIYYDLLMRRFGL